MNNSDFCHLHLHSMYSFLDGFGSPEAYAQRASVMGFKYLACTDHGSIDGLIKFQQACEKYGIKPVLGCEAYIVPEVSKERKNGHILLLIKNRKGFKNLTHMLSFANHEGFYYKPRITYDLLLDHCEGLVVSTACMQSFVNMPGGEDLFWNLYEKIGNDLYCEVMPNKLKAQTIHNYKIISMTYSKIMKSSKIKIIATNDCHYIQPSDSKVQEVLLAVQNKAKWTDKNRFKFSVKNLYLRSADKMVQALKAINCYKDEYLTNTIEVAEKCGDFRIKKRKIRLPNIEGISNSIAEADELWQMCHNGYYIKIHNRLHFKFDKEYFDRFKEEFELIKKKNFIRYILIIAELTTWCKENDILIGPRGSVCGSLIAYLIGITNIDPIKHDLYFSRFITEDRIDYPDIDIDFEDSKRHFVKEHLEEKYGHGKIANVSSFVRMQSRAAVSDVSRVFGIPDAEVNRFTKLIDYKSEDGINEAIAMHEEGRDFAKKHTRVIKLAKKLEGQVRNRSQHAAAIVISNRALSTSAQCVLIRKGDITLTNWEKDDAEYMGLMKLDALGLKFLSILSETKKLVEQNLNVDINFDKIPLDDKKIFKFLSDPDNLSGIFQLSGYANKSQVAATGIKNFNDIAISTALARPGPLGSGMTDEYNKRKKSNKWPKDHPIYENITKDTKGIVVFQEQVIAIMIQIAGMSEGAADNIRKVIGKKRDRKEFEPYKKQFVRGCKKMKTFSRDEAEDFWEGLLSWSSYGFGKGHATGYSVVAYWCAYLKYYYPTEFTCATLTFAPKEKIKETVEQAYKLGLSLILPRISSPYTEISKWVARDNKLYIPWDCIKGIAEKKAKQILETKMPVSPFTSHNADTEFMHKGKLGELLHTIDAYRYQDEIKETTSEMQKYFSFRITANPRQEYKSLYKLFPTIGLRKLDPVLQGDLKELQKLNKKTIRVRRFKGYDDDLSSCTKCELINECTSPVPPSSGRYNVVIIGEAPGFEEDRDRIGFVGKSGQTLWKLLGLDRTLFHITNICKCFPSKTRTPKVKNIQECSHWIDKELQSIKPALILAFGNTSLYYFEGVKTGITNYNATTRWSEKYGCWICYCLHPAAMLHNPENKAKFSSGIKNFKKTFEVLKSRSRHET